MRHAGMVLMREPAMSSSPAGLVSGHLAVLSAIAPGPADAVRAGLLEALSQVPDPRDRRGVRYDLVAVLTAVDPAALDRPSAPGSAARLSAGRPPQARIVLAVDGKTLRGARTASSP